MDPVYERRELTRIVSVPSRFLQKSIQVSLLNQLRATTEGKCGSEGFIGKDSVTILAHSLGRVNALVDKVDYHVRIQADVCMPHPGQVFKVPVSFRSRIGVHCELTPMKILLPRDLHLGNAEFEAIEETGEIEIEVIGSQFQKEDDHIYVLGKLVRRINGAPVAVPDEVLPVAAPEVVQQPEGTKSIVVNTSADAAPRRRRRMVKENAGTLQIDVSAPEGKA